MAGDMDRGYNLPNDAALRSVGLDSCEILRFRDEIRLERARKHKEMVIALERLKRSSCLRGHWGAICGM